MQDLGVLPGGPLSVAYGVSGDGGSVVGMSYAGPTSPGDYRPFRWRQATGMVNLGLLSGGQYGWANAVNGDGTVIVGQNWMGNDYNAFIWTQAAGMQDLKVVLIAAGLDLSGWTLQTATGVSSDGSTITGNGVGPNGSLAWIATLAATNHCDANCDNSTTAPILNVLDFTCFLNKFAAGDTYANCDGSTTPPVLNVLDFTCFLNRFAAGCS
jgi:probable HAF family extracellular repeat protein